MNFQVGERIVGQTQQVELIQLIKYAGASGDFNPLHFDFDYAKQKGQKAVLMHGMLGAGILSTLTTEIAGESGFVKSFDVRFTKELLVDSSVTPEAMIEQVTEQQVNVQLMLKNEFGEIATKGTAIISWDN